MTKTDQWDLPGLEYSDCWGYTAPDGKEYAVIGSLDSIHIFNISDPYNINQVASILGGASSTIWRDFKVYENYLYCVADQSGTNEGLIVIDLTDLPNSVNVVTRNNTDFFRAHNIYIEENTGRAYVVGARKAGVGSVNLIIFDLDANPADPPVIYSGSMNGGYIHDIFVRNNIAFASHGNGGLRVYDVTDVSNITQLGLFNGYPESGYNHSSWLTDDGTSLVFCDETKDRGVKIVDVTDYGNIEMQDLFRSTLEAPTATNSLAHNPFVKGNYVYISYYHDGVQVYDISDPENVTKAAYYDTYPTNTTYSGGFGAWGVYPFFASGTIIASDIDNGLFVLSANLPNDNCQKVVQNINSGGIGSLKGAIACAENGDTISFNSNIANDTIFLEERGIAITKSLTIIADPSKNIYVSGQNVDRTFDIDNGTNVLLEGFNIISSNIAEGAAIFNAGTLTLKNMNCFEISGQSLINNHVFNEGDIIIQGTCNIKL
jgi:choice-of-anchor B domain-containing protein